MYRYTISKSEVFTVKEFAEATGYSVSTVRKWLSIPGEHLPFDRKNGRIFIPAEEGLEWMAGHGKKDKFDEN